MPQKGHNQSIDHWDGANQDNRKANKFVLDTNIDSSLRMPPLPDIEVTPCHCFPGEMCYDACSIRKQFQEVTPKQCSKRFQTAANGYSAQGMNTEKFPGVKVLVGRNGLPIIVNPSFAFPSPSKGTHHLDKFPDRDPSMLSLGGQDGFSIPPPTPMSSSLPKSQLPILSLLSARECSSAPAICRCETDSESSLFLSSPSSRSSSLSRGSETSLSSTRRESRKSVVPATGESDNSNVAQHDNNNCNNTTLQAEFNELLVHMNPSSSLAANCADALSPSAISQSHAPCVSDDIPPSTSRTPSCCANSPPSSSFAAPSSSTIVPVDVHNPSRVPAHGGGGSASAAPRVSVHIPASSKTTIQVAPSSSPTCHSASPSSPVGFPFSPTFSSFRSSSSRSFSGRTAAPASSTPAVATATSPSCPSLPRKEVHSPTAPRSRGQPSIPPILEHSPLSAPTKASASAVATATAPRVATAPTVASATPIASGTSKASSSSCSSSASSSSSTRAPVVSSHRCQVLNLTDAIRQLNGGLFEDESPTEVFQDYYDWIEGRS